MWWPWLLTTTRIVTLPETVLWSGYGEIREKKAVIHLYNILFVIFQIFIYTNIKLAHLITGNSNNI